MNFILHKYLKAKRLEPGAFLRFLYSKITLIARTAQAATIGGEKPLQQPGQRDCEVVFWIDNDNAPYIITKPIHHTQKLLTEDAGGKIFSIRVIPNFELERELLGFGSKIRVLGPRSLVKRVKDELGKAMDRHIKAWALA